MCRHLFRDRAVFASVVLLAVVVLSVATATRAHADELDALHRQILQNPADSQLNLRFARIAEETGHLRWALTAYERVVVNDPNNVEARDGLQRVRRKLQPSFTLMTVQVGAQYESNPNYYLSPRQSEVQALGAVSVLDERVLAGRRWRTNAYAAGIYHPNENDLTYGVAGLDTGPVLDGPGGWAVHPSIGGRAAYFDQRFYYSEGALGVAFDTNASGIYRSLSVRGAYRAYDGFFPSSDGFYVEARGKLAAPGVLGEGSVVILSPWVLWSDISGTAQVVTPINSELQPGAYLEYGGRVEFIRALNNWLSVGAHISVSERDYRTDVVATTGDNRRDTIISPGASFLFPNLFAYQTDLRLDYRYILDDSNDPTKSFNDHIVTLSAIARFDPTLPRKLAQAGGGRP